MEGLDNIIYMLDEMLDTKRNATLDEIHFKERQLDRLDYLRFEMKLQNKNK